MGPTGFLDTFQSSIMLKKCHTRSFTYKKNLKYQTTANFKPKKEGTIEGVFDPEKKYKAVESASQDLWGTSNGAFQVFSVPNQTLEKTQVAECDPEKYLAGVDKAAKHVCDKVSGQILDTLQIIQAKKGRFNDEAFFIYNWKSLASSRPPLLLQTLHQ